MCRDNPICLGRIYAKKQYQKQIVYWQKRYYNVQKEQENIQNQEDKRRVMPMMQLNYDQLNYIDGMIELFRNAARDIDSQLCHG